MLTPLIWRKKMFRGCVRIFLFFFAHRKSVAPKWRLKKVNAAQYGTA